MERKKNQYRRECKIILRKKNIEKVYLSLSYTILLILRKYSLPLAEHVFPRIITVGEIPQDTRKWDAGIQMSFTEVSTSVPCLWKQFHHHSKRHNHMQYSPRYWVVWSLFNHYKEDGASICSAIIPALKKEMGEN